MLNYTMSDLKFAEPRYDLPETSEVRINIFGHPERQGIIVENESVLFSSDFNPINISLNDKGSPVCTGYGATQHEGDSTVQKIKPRVVEVMTTINHPHTGYKIQLSSRALVERNGSNIKLDWETQRGTQKIAKPENPHYKPKSNPNLPQPNPVLAKAFESFASQVQDRAVGHASKVFEHHLKRQRFSI